MGTSARAAPESTPELAGRCGRPGPDEFDHQHQQRVADGEQRAKEQAEQEPAPVGRDKTPDFSEEYDHFSSGSMLVEAVLGERRM
jgi:hypothetical protein